MSVEYGWEITISCDDGRGCIEDCGVIDHIHRDVPKNGLKGYDIRLDPLLKGWALEVGGEDIDYCPLCRDLLNES